MISVMPVSKIRLALRANYDFLTQLLSRSGLYESLRTEPFSPSRNCRYAQPRRGQMADRQQIIIALNVHHAVRNQNDLGSRCGPITIS
jgi:hypothetical protein